MKVYVGCIGCEQRKLDAQRIIDFARVNGLLLADGAEVADLAIVVTCGVDEAARRMSLGALEIIRRSAPRCALIVAGCLPLIDPVRVQTLNPKLTVSPRTLGKLDNIFPSHVSVSMDTVRIPARSCFDSVVKDGSSPRERYEAAKNGYKVVVNHGCLSRCSYCAIRTATGSLQSESADTITYQFEAGVAANEPTIMLMGGDVGAYGRDIGSNFPCLLKRLLSIKGGHRVFVHDYNLHWFLRDLPMALEAFAQGRDQVEAVMLPVQSGSNRILRMMRRPYASAAVLNALKKLRSVAPVLKIGTHVIVGFPGETDDDFEATCALLRESEIDFISCFSYSDHPAADAHRLPGKVEANLVWSRIERMQAVFGETVRVYGSVEWQR